MAELPPLELYENALRRGINLADWDRRLGGMGAAVMGAATVPTLAMWPAMPLAGPAATALGVAGIAGAMDRRQRAHARQQGLEADLEALYTSGMRNRLAQDY